MKSILVFDNYRDRPHILEIRTFSIEEEKAARAYYQELCKNYNEGWPHNIRAYLTSSNEEPKLIWSSKKDKKYKEGQLNG